MNVMRTCIAVVVLTLVLPSTLHGQVSATDLNLALTAIRRQVDATEARNGSAPTPAELRDRWERTRKAVDWLIGRSGKTNLADVTPEYLRSLQRAAEVANSASADQWEDVASELEAKVEHCRRLNIGMGGSVLLKVDTRRAAGPVGNWQVFYLLKFYESVKGASPANFPG